MPVASIATWPCGSQSTAKTSAAGADMVRGTSMRSVMDRWCQGVICVEPRFGDSRAGNRRNEMPPNTVDTTTTKPAMLRHAIAFIHENAHRDITLSDIAASVNVTPRSVQYTFRRHVGSTPLEYLR